MKCRLCSNIIEEPFLSLGNQPLANSYIRKEDLYKIENYYPLDVYVCPNCLLVQIIEYVQSRDIFTPDYAYFSSYSTTTLEHSKEYVKMIVERFKLDNNSKIVEIGSNDGYLLQYFKDYGISILGIEPAIDTAIEAIKKDIPTHMLFFNTDYANKMKDTFKFDLIIGNNVLAHNPDLNDFVKAMKMILKQDGIITIEFPHLLNLMNNNLFDTCYHEHFSYFTFISVQKLFKNNDLVIFDVEEIPTHGGSLRIYVKHASNKTNIILDSVSNLILKEVSYNLNHVKTYYNFASKVSKLKKDILKLLIELKENNNKIIGYGAAAKCSTLLNYCGIGNDFIDYVVDISPYKQNKFLPGNHIPIESPDIIKQDKPDYIIIFPWNLKDEIKKQLEYTKEWGCKLVTLIPEINIIT